MVLSGVTTGRLSEVNWLFRGGLALFFPEQWHRLEEAIPPARRGGDIVEAYAQMLSDPDPEVCRRAAEEWCMWESATPYWPPTNGLDDRFMDPDYSLAFARIVTHYVRHNLWLEDGILLRDARALSKTPGILVNGRFDYQAPIGNAWALRRVWPKAELVIVNEAGHMADTNVTVELVRATDSFANS